VIERIAPGSTVIDLTHGIARHQINQGAAVLANALPFAPPGVHLAVVDPGVGSPRRALAVRVAEDDRVLVGPDNGLLWPSIERFGGVAEAVDVSQSPFRLEPTSATFHGRDVFAPDAARIALGAALGEAGEPIDADSVVRLASPAPAIESERAICHVVSVDGYGNVVLDLTAGLLPGRGLRLGSPLIVEASGASRDAVFGRAFADVPAGELLVYEDSNRSFALALNRGSAAGALGLAPGDEVIVRPRE
jgi:S-adenosylmethionine hydrolase